MSRVELPNVHFLRDVLYWSMTGCLFTFGGVTEMKPVSIVFCIHIGMLSTGKWSSCFIALLIFTYLDDWAYTWNLKHDWIWHGFATGWGWPYTPYERDSYRHISMGLQSALHVSSCEPNHQPCQMLIVRGGYVRVPKVEDHFTSVRWVMLW